MAFTRPTLPELIERVEGDIKSGLGLVILLRRSFLKVIARVLAGLAHLMFGFFTFMEKQYFEDTATGDYLKRKGAIWDVYTKPATIMEFNVSVVGAAGTVITLPKIFKRSDGVQYSLVEEVTLTGTDDELHLLANVAGKAPEVFPGDSLNFESPVAGVESTVTVTEVIIEPEDAEDLDTAEGAASFRARLLAKIRNPSSGGTADDYLRWALTVPGITRSWVNPQGLGPGTVLVYVVSDDEDPITPSAPKIEEVADYIETLRPVTANVTVVAPVLYPLDMTIKIKPNTSVVQAAIIAELEDLILRESNIAGSYKGPGTLNDGKLLLSRINEAISLAVGEEDHEIVSINGDTTPGDQTPPDGNLIVLGDITWQALA